MDLKVLGANIANHSGFLDLYSFSRNKLKKSQVAILQYHSVRPKNIEFSEGAISPLNFEKQMEYFSRNYEFLSLDELSHFINRKRPLPTKAIIVTFDDGYKDNYLYAYPILKRFNIPATIFLTTGSIGTGNLFWWDNVRYNIENTRITKIDLDELGNFHLKSMLNKRFASSTIIERMKKLSEMRKNLLIGKLVEISKVDIPPQLGISLTLSWDEIKEMSYENITFGAHSVSHAILTKLSKEQVKYEIVQSKKDIEDKIKQKVNAFSYPNGEFNAEVVKLVKESGFTCAVSVFPGKLISRKDNIYTLSRIGGVEDFNKFKVEFSGLWGDLQSILRKRE